MKRLWILPLLLGAAIMLGLLWQKGGTKTASASTPRAVTESEIVAKVLKMAEVAKLNELSAIPAERYVIPPAGVDVMRVRMEGTYTVNGIGTETIELGGWFACIHREGRPAPGQTEVSWKTAIVETEFVGFDIRGESKIFGPVHVYLDPSLRSYGQAGALNLPELAVMKSLRKTDDGARPRECCPKPPDSECVAVMNLKVDMPQLGLKMQTKEALRNYSFVDTIPPVGATPSFTLETTELVSDGRVVGSLQNSSARLREIIIKAPFNGSEVAMRRPHLK